KSATQDAFLGNNRAKEDTLVDKNADTTLNFGGNNTGGGGGGGALHLPWLLTLAALLLARRQRRT
ncbi:MAG: GlyGly-CTERM sorting domain-containing protein, partial [Pseudomonadota bacterium]|nr:GlyGly-CTERM sorting domain-containing protein [Pseudomonadota bacterium]